MKHADMRHSDVTPKPGPRIGRGKAAGKSEAGSLHKATARLDHEVRCERPMTDWGQGCGPAKTGKHGGGKR